MALNHGRAAISHQHRDVQRSPGIRDTRERLAVRVIREPVEFGRLRTGDILVRPYTNPAWTPLFQRAAAVVVDTGGLGSHAAIVAREYGIPAIMGTGTGTSFLVEDQIVTVDGDHGRVVPGNAD